MSIETEDLRSRLRKRARTMRIFAREDADDGEYLRAVELENYGTAFDELADDLEEFLAD